MPKLPLGGTGRDFDSKKSRGKLVNVIAEGNKDGSYRTIKGCDGLTEYSIGLDAIRSNFLVNGGFSYYVSGLNLFRVNSSGVSSDLGVIGGTGQGQILSNSVPGNNQILVLNGGGQGYIFNNSGLNQITDLDFFPTTSGTILNERFWFVRDDTNEFFASEISDGFNYNPLSFATAEESPDNVVAIIAKRSSLWVINETTMEFWQTFSDTLLPVRKVRSSTIERGINARASLAEVGKHFAFLADDLTVRMVSGSDEITISDLDFNLKIRGNGTPTFPGFSVTNDAIGFFVDSPTHKIYYLTFPTEGFTWGYDLLTGFSHTRKSESIDYWRAGYSVIFDNKIIVGDLLTSSIWILDPAAKAEGAEILRTIVRTPGISFDHDTTLPSIELDMEVGQILDQSISPVVMVRYTKDGGFNWINGKDIQLGTKGNYRKRVPLRQFGRIVRYKDFQLELIVTDPVRVQFYGADFPKGQSI